MSPAIFPVIGMKCSGCATIIAKALASLPGVESVEVSLQDGTVTVVWNGGRALLLKVRATINSLGYGIDDLKMFPATGSQCKLPQVEG